MGERAEAVSPELREDLKELDRMKSMLTEEERNAPLNKLRTVNQVAVAGFAIACALKAVSETKTLPGPPPQASSKDAADRAAGAAALVQQRKVEST